MSTSRFRRPITRALILGASASAAMLLALGARTLASVEAQTPPIGTFAAAGSMGGPRLGHSSALLQSGQVLIYGSAPVAELYDPATRRTEFLTTPSRDLVLFATLTTLRDGKVLVAGGYRVDPVTELGTPVATALLFDPRVRTWTAVGSMTVPRAFHTATLLQDGRVLVIGGLDTAEATNPTPASLRTSEVFDPATGRFTKSGSIPNDEAGHTATLLADGKVLVSNDVAYLYDPAPGTFSLLGSAPTPRFGGAAARLQDGTVLLVGGEGTSGAATSGAERFDPSTGRFSPAGRLAQVRTLLTASTLPTGHVLVVGGSSGVGDDAHATTEVYDPASNSFSPGPSMSVGRTYHATTTLPDGRVLVTGGFTASGALASIEIFTPAAGAKPYAGGAPAAGSQGLIVTTRTASADDLVKAASADGCSPRVIGVLQGGTWRIFIPGAPAAVNSGFPATIPPSTPLFMGCS